MYWQGAFVREILLQEIAKASVLVLFMSGLWLVTVSCFCQNYQQ